MKELTNEELHNRQMYYQGYLQCFADLRSMAKEYIESNNTHLVSLDEKEIDEIYQAMQSKIFNAFDFGYMYYDEKDKKLKFEESFKDENN